MARTSKSQKPQKSVDSPDNVTQLTPKRKGRVKAFLDAAAETVTGDSPLVPMDATERYRWQKTLERLNDPDEYTKAYGPFAHLAPAQQVAWERMWDMIIAKALPHVVAYIQAQMEQEQHGKAA